MKCRVCKEQKTVKDFSKDNRAKSGFRTICKDCDKTTKILYKPRNGKTLKQNAHDYWKAKYYAEGGKELNRARGIAYYHKNKHDPYFIIKSNTYNLLNCMIKSGLRGHNWNTRVGYSSDKLIEHLQNQFDEIMNWDNYGKDGYWEIDHIIPSSHFYYETVHDESYKDCWELSNLRPLKISKNRQKGNSILIEVTEQTKRVKK